MSNKGVWNLFLRQVQGVDHQWHTIKAVPCSTTHWIMHKGATHVADYVLLGSVPTCDRRAVEWMTVLGKEAERKGH